MNYSELATAAFDKTRIAILSADNSIALLLHKIAKANSVSFELVSSNNGQFGEDFIAISSENPENISQFQPNVLFITQKSEGMADETLLRNITGGGILVYPEDTQLPTTENYFRKIPYSKPDFTNNGGNLLLPTEMGSIPVPSEYENIMEDILGLQQICQQIGIMEEDFFETLMSA